jgi:ribonucleoside-triphosphate reductase
MATYNYELPFDDASPPREGRFDEQLSIPTPAVATPEPFSTIVKRDGREVPYDTHKIATAIFKAAQTVGGHDLDRADRLATGVTLYLTRRHAGAPPGVDQVNDAVEKVLIEMGHAKTALAYARYRDRRARIRSLQQGDIGTLLGELEAAQREPQPATPGPLSLFVRTSDDRLIGWDRERIVDALIRETGMEQGVANLIALEVEKQITTAQVKTLTAALVRELVDAKLIEHGLEEYRSKHTRLGVPLFDAERIVCLANQGEEEIGQDPAGTDLVLAEHVKRAYAQSQVFSQDVTDAHLVGDIHVHLQGQIDRLHSATCPPEYIKAFGLTLPGARGFAQPPANAETFVAQLGHLHAALRNHFAESIHWDALNLYMAPLMAEYNPPALTNLAAMTVFELARRTRRQRKHCNAAFSLYWHTPPWAEDRETLAEGGEYNGRVYGEYREPAQCFALALLDALKGGTSDEHAWPGPTARIQISDRFFETSRYDRFLCHAAEAALASGRVQFVFDRHEAAFGVDPNARSARDVAAQWVSINLPRVAFRSTNQTEFEQELHRVMRAAVQAHEQKRDFSERLLSLKDIGPWGLLAKERNGRPFFDSTAAVYRIGLLGLDECVAHRCTLEGDDAGTRATMAQSVVETAARCCESLARDHNLRLELAFTEDDEVQRRFAVADVQQFTEAARTVVKTDGLTQELYYAPGAYVALPETTTPIERVRREGELHPYAAGPALTTVHIPEDDASPESLAEFIEKAYHQTSSRGVVILPEYFG